MIEVIDMLSDKKVKLERNRFLIPKRIRDKFELNNYIYLEGKEENGRRTIILKPAEKLAASKEGNTYGEN
jgi:bifunctional DNA-binding transcriptional regulator/antitoxin component of YhaV-PrlF toxin-antitoxin module